MSGPRASESPPVPFARRAAAWLAWWVLLMGLWVAVDDSIGLAELGAGAGAAALGALLAEVAGHQAATRFRMRLRWLVPARRLPGQILGDTVAGLAALARQLARGEQPASGIQELPALVRGPQR